MVDPAAWTKRVVGVRQRERSREWFASDIDADVDKCRRSVDATRGQYSDRTDGHEVICIKELDGQCGRGKEHGCMCCVARRSGWL